MYAGFQVTQIQTLRKKEMGPEWRGKGNQEAYVLAVRAAQLHKLSREEANIIIQMYKDLELIENRLMQVTRIFQQKTYKKRLLEHKTFKER